MNFSKKIRRHLCVLLAAVSIAGTGIITTTFSDNSMMTVSAVSATTKTASVSSVAACLQKAKLTSNKTYISSIRTNKANGRYNVWRAGDQLLEIKSSDSKIAKIGKDGNARYISIGDGSKLGKAVVIAKYKSGITDKITVYFRGISSRSSIEAGKTTNFSYTGGKSPVKTIQVLSGSQNASVSKNGKFFKVIAKKSGSVSVKVIYENNLVEERVIYISSPKNKTTTSATTQTKSTPVKCEMKYTYNQFMNMGVIYYQNKRFTYYSQSVLPGYGLNIPGRHVEGGYVSDGDGYIVLASPNLTAYPRYSTIDTPFGRKGKFYDYCPGGSFDVYVQ